MDKYIIEAEIEALEQEPTDYETCERLAILYVVRDHLKAEPLETGGSEFLEACDDKDPEEVMLVIDELMNAQKLLYPKVYDEIIAKIKALR